MFIMPKAIRAHHLTPEDREAFNRWRFAFFIALSCAVLIALAAFEQRPPTEVSIRPTGPMPGVSVP
ncbi:hypothetical protein AS156_27555 [Bradyrhizobium macuxiense]|uniref:Uncharacterized protein n=1 Tax=Bradyrhizobium macuxiense TaxID=1755647 RepID=A0A125QAK2_9BRAD|nr:hypothetical protein [Bradyrhizobium macuxiense]KWV60800.1 hypothetical protein AS156_27555 [Bradyrhizobium macuxiense]